MVPDFFIPELVPPASDPGLREPRLWVRRIAIFEKQGTPPLRNIRLKPGLNIVWTPDLLSSGKRALAHGSGKTTFCRLLRACLGETDFASDTQRHRLHHKLPEGFFAAEVMIQGTCWVSIHPFGLEECFVAHVDSIESALERGRLGSDPKTLDPIIRQTFFSDLVGLVPSEIDTDQIWDVMRAWLSRDQECRLGDILSWRSPKTQTHSRAQVISEAAKLAMVRLAVRALDKEEVSIGIKERKLAKKAEDERKRQSLLADQRRERIKTLRAALDVGNDVGFEDELDRKGLISLATARFEASLGIKLPEPLPETSFVATLRDLRTSLDARKEELRQLQGDANKKRSVATALRSEAELGEVDLAQGAVRVCPICRVPISEILASKCGISLERCDVEATKQQLEQKKAKAASLDDEASSIDDSSQEVSGAISEIENQMVEVEAKAEQAETERTAALDAKTAIEDNVYEARRLLDEARALKQESELTPPAESKNEELVSLRLQLEEGRSRAQKAILMLETQYRAIMAAWLPDGVDGVIKLDGNGLKVDVEFDGRGEVSTAALDSLKIVAFDLAVLHLATEGKATLPAFLIHDSPREADLDAMLYARLFEMIAEWEKDAESPCFQYIVTTTTAPPPELQGDDFVKLRMSSTPKEERLFRTDL